MLLRWEGLHFLVDFSSMFSLNVSLLDFCHGQSGCREPFLFLSENQRVACRPAKLKTLIYISVFSNNLRFLESGGSLFSTITWLQTAAPFFFAFVKSSIDA